jgi:hypothetical protein
MIIGLLLRASEFRRIWSINDQLNSYGDLGAPALSDVARGFLAAENGV